MFRAIQSAYSWSTTHLSRTSKQMVTVTNYLVTQARSMTRAEAKDAAVSFGTGVVLGDFSKDPTAAAHAGRFVGNVIPIVGMAASARDCVAAAHRLSQGEAKASIDLTLGVLSFFPGARLATNALRGAQSAMNHGTQLAELAKKIEADAKAKETLALAPPETKPSAE